MSHTAEKKDNFVRTSIRMDADLDKELANWVHHLKQTAGRKQSKDAEVQKAVRLYLDTLKGGAPKPPSAPPERVTGGAIPPIDIRPENLDAHRQLERCLNAGEKAREYGFNLLAILVDAVREIKSVQDHMVVPETNQQDRSGRPKGKKKVNRGVKERT